jgi:hypothetical protein
MKQINSQPRGVKQRRDAFLGVRVTSDELRDWEKTHVKHGQVRSAVVRNALGLGKKVVLPAKRPELGKADAYDYYRAMRIRESATKISLALKDVLKHESTKVPPTFADAVELVHELINEIAIEVDGFQRQCGSFNEPGQKSEPERVVLCT